MNTIKHVAALLLIVTAGRALAADASALQFHSRVHEGGEAWLIVQNRGAEPVTVREFRWSDSPRTGLLDLTLEPRQQSNVALPHMGKPPLWVLLGDAGWVSESGERADATLPADVQPSDPAAIGGFVTVDESPSPPPTQPAAASVPESEPAFVPAPAAPRAASPAVVSGWSVVLNSFVSPDRARADAQAVSRLGYEADVVEGESAGKRWYRVRVRGYASAPEARAAVAELAARHGRAGAWILHD